MPDMPTEDSKAKLRVISRLADHARRLAELKAVVAGVAKKRNTDDPILTHSVQRALDLEAKPSKRKPSHRSNVAFASVCHGRVDER